MRESDLQRIGMVLTLAVTAACAKPPSSGSPESPQSEPVPVTTVFTPERTNMPPFFTEALQQTLEGWMENENYDHDSLEPLAEYSKDLFETSVNRGWRGMKTKNEPSIEVWVGESDSPELLQESDAVFFKIDDELRGFLWNKDGTYSLQGEGEDRVEGTLSHFSGEVEGNYEGTFEEQIPIDPYAPFQFLMVWRGPNNFQGWIDFRNVGRMRPFGGGKDKDSFPNILMWRED